MVTRIANVSVMSAPNGQIELLIEDECSVYLDWGHARMMAQVIIGLTEDRAKAAGLVDPDWDRPGGKD